MQVSTPQEFLKHPDIPVIDVRTPAEFAQGHIPGAINIPVLDNEERRIIGILYKQEGKTQAIEKGLELVGPKAPLMFQAARKVAENGHLRVYCWRGGMRSKNMAALFELGGIQCTLLDGGYKAYRAHSRELYDGLKNLIVLAGPTGSGKTDILKALSELGEQVIDLEGLACHKGSVFGDHDQETQPSTEHFQNLLSEKIQSLDLVQTTWIESESQSIGNVFMPQELWRSMNSAKIIEIEMPREIRAKRLMLEYGNMTYQALEKCILQIREQLGGANTKLALQLAEEKNSFELAMMLLEYYDKRYAYGRQLHRNGPLTTIVLDSPDAVENAKKIALLK